MQSRSDGGDGLTLRIALKYLRTLHTRGRLGSGLRQLVQITAILAGQMQLRTSTDKGHRQ
jgi:hypothetical protein